MKRKEAIFITVLFSLLLLVPLIATVITPDRVRSDWENRELAQIPDLKTLSAEKIFSGAFGEEFKNYFTDQFAFRDFWLKLKRVANSSLMIRESNGVYIGKTALFDVPDQIDEAKFDKNIASINTFVKKYNLPSSIILVPSAGSLFPEELPFAAPKMQDTELIEKAYSRLEGVEKVDAASALSSLPLSKAFYKTDHHWTTRGAAAVYCAWRGEREFEFEQVSDSFLGTLTSRSGDISVKADIIERIKSGDKFVSCKVYDGKKVDAYPSMYFNKFLGEKDKYSYFLGTNEPIVTLEAEGGNGKTLLVFKDSFAHSFVQCAAEDWSRIVLVDLRYLKERVSQCELIPSFDEVDEVLFLYGIENFTTQNYSGILY